MHKPIKLLNVSLHFQNKICFENFSSTINFCDKLGIIGRNGSGKSSLLKILNQSLKDFEGQIILPDGLYKSYVPQIVENNSKLSGGEKFNESLTEALSTSPDLLLLDEPTNHLDSGNRKSLINMLSKFNGTLIIATHDEEIIRKCTNKIWLIEDQEIHIFNGTYNNFLEERKAKHSSISSELEGLDKQIKHSHHNLMKEQVRASKSRKKGEKNISNRKWPTVVSTAKARRAEETSGKKSSSIHALKNNLVDQISKLKIPENIILKFDITPSKTSLEAIVNISDGNCGYGTNTLIQDISLSINSGERVAITGENASGKSTFIKSFLIAPDILRSGNWYTPRPENIGYLDQHYFNLDNNSTPYEIIKSANPKLSPDEIRRHLNSFLFRKNEEVNNKVSNLSGGEKVRLSLAQIAAKPPQLLILDEITNNLDLQTKQHISDILKHYKGAMIIISHEDAFLAKIDIDTFYEIKEKRLLRNFKGL